VLLDVRSKLKTAADVDSLISAEFPDPQVHPELYELVKQLMLHGPCGKANPDAQCMDKDSKKCTNNFPKNFCEETTIQENGYPIYRRQDTGQKHIHCDQEYDNCWVMPYCAFLLLTF